MGWLRVKAFCVRGLAIIYNLWYNSNHMKTHLTILHVGAHSGIFDAKHERTMWTVFAFASIGGLLFGILLNDHSLLARINFRPTDQLGAIGTVEVAAPSKISLGVVATSSPEVLGAETSLPTREDTALIAEAQKIADAKFDAYNTSLREISNTINQDELAILRLNQEMKLVKDASVSLVADFNQNCGSWSDVCGNTYASKLQQYNDRYDELLKEQNKVELNRNTALESRNSLTNSQ